MSNNDVLNRRGWGGGVNSRKWHYYVNGRSLCGRYMLFSKAAFDGLNDSNHKSPDNCAACKKKQAKLKP